MADQPKPRKIKDLKARLGRTIAPNTEGGAVPPPGVGGNGLPQPVVGQGGVVPPPGIGGQSSAGLAKPPFGEHAPKKPVSADPFAGASQPPAAGPKEVRLVIDDTPVDDAEVGKKARGKVFVLLGFGLVLGLGLGYVGGTASGKIELHDRAIADGKSIYDSVRGASATIEQARGMVDSLAKAAKGAPGTPPKVDFEAIEGLRALEKPFEAGAFSRKMYSVFAAGTVDDLFNYYNNVTKLWDLFERLGNRSLPEKRRKELEAAVEATGNLARPKGCVPSIQNDTFMCSLVYLTPVEGGDGTKVNVSQRAASHRTAEKNVFVGRGEFTEENVVLVNTEQSIGVLGEQAGAFAEYQASLGEISQLFAATTEIQGRLEKALGEIAAMAK